MGGNDGGLQNNAVGRSPIWPSRLAEVLVIPTYESGAIDPPGAVGIFTIFIGCCLFRLSGNRRNRPC